MLGIILLFIWYEGFIMPKRNESRTIDDIRKRNAASQRKFYYKHLESERKRKRESEAKKRKLSKESKGDTWGQV